MGQGANMTLNNFSPYTLQVAVVRKHCIFPQTGHDRTGIDAFNTTLAASGGTITGVIENKSSSTGGDLCATDTQGRRRGRGLPERVVAPRAGLNRGARKRTAGLAVADGCPGRVDQYLHSLYSLPVAGSGAGAGSRSNRCAPRRLTPIQIDQEHHGISDQIPGAYVHIHGSL